MGVKGNLPVLKTGIRSTQQKGKATGARVSEAVTGDPELPVFYLAVSILFTAYLCFFLHF